MRENVMLLTLCSMLLAPCSAVQAQQPAKIPRVVFLSTSDTAADSGRFDGIRQRLRELGYIEGQNIAIEYRTGGAKLERYHNAVAELVRLKVDIIVVGGGTSYVSGREKGDQDHSHRHVRARVIRSKQA